MSKDMSRLGLFVFYDPQGIVDNYVIHLLKHFRPHFSKLIIISNGAFTEISKNRLAEHADNVFIRENQGLDAAAYKAGLVSFCGWEEVEKYDEVVLINDTFFGPIHSFDDMFDQMSRRDVDFWGMSTGYHSIDGWNRVKYGYIPDHIQTFFTAFRRNMVCSEAFQSYWNQYDDSQNDFVSVVTQHEVVMTKHFQDLGFRWDTYANTTHYRSDLLSENFNIYHYHPLAMMRDLHFPVLKRKVMNVNLSEHLCVQDLESAAEAMEYVHTQTDYDTAMIWDNILRLYNLSDLYHTLHLNYIFPSIPVASPAIKRVALVYQVSNAFFAREFCKHANRISESIDIYMIVENPNALAVINECIQNTPKITLLNSSNQDTPMGAFVLCCKDLAAKYDYLGFVHDTNNADHAATAILESTVYGYLQNIANDPAYISQIINCFEQNPKLGVLGIPFSVHDYGFSSYLDMWGDCFNTVKSLADQLRISCNICQEKFPFMIVDAFWCRTAAIRCIWNKEWKPNDFVVSTVTCTCKTNDALVRLLPYIAQSAHYYSGIVMHTNYASMRLTSQQYMLNQLTETLHTQLGIVPGRYLEYINQLRRIHYKSKDMPMSIDLSKLGIVAIIRIFLERKTPQWVTRNILKLIRYRKNRKK